MRSEVEAGGAIREWLHGDVGRLRRWVKQRPWGGQVGPLAVRVPSARLERSLDALCTFIHAATNFGEELEIEILHAVNDQSDPETLLWTRLSMTRKSRRNLAKSLAALCAIPRLFIISIPTSMSGAAWLEKLMVLTDINNKLREPGALAFMIAQTGPTIVADALRLDRAWPTYAMQRGGLRAQWATYAHERVAWHCAGVLDRVDEVATQLSARSVRTSRAESNLEDVFDEHALHTFDRLTAHQREKLTDDIDEVRLWPVLQLDPSISGAASSAVRPAPWLARALLQRVPSHQQKRYLRSLQVCRPYANRLLGRCMELEQMCRDRLEPSLTDTALDDETAKRHKYLIHKPNAMDHRIHPRGRRQIRDPWDVGGFGSVIRASSSADVELRAQDSMEQLRQLRNALAHGAEVGWAATELLARIEAGLG